MAAQDPAWIDLWLADIHTTPDKQQQMGPYLIEPRKSS
jgi:hypothetical protein